MGQSSHGGLDDPGHCRGSGLTEPFENPTGSNVPIIVATRSQRHELFLQYLQIGYLRPYMSDVIIK